MKINHYALFALDLEAVRLFFVRYFDATAGPQYHNTRTGFRSYMLTFGDGSRLEIMSRPETSAHADDARRHPYAPGYHHLSLSVGSREDVNDLAARLAADGYATTDGPRVTGDGYYEAAIAGPEGLILEIMADM